MGGGGSKNISGGGQLNSQGVSSKIANFEPSNLKKNLDMSNFVIGQPTSHLKTNINPQSKPSSKLNENKPGEKIPGKHMTKDYK